MPPKSKTKPTEWYIYWSQPDEDSDTNDKQYVFDISPIPWRTQINGQDRHIVYRTLFPDSIIHSAPLEYKKQYTKWSTVKYHMGER